MAALPSRPDLSLSPDEADLSALALEAFTGAVGGRDALRTTLLVADGTPEVTQILDLLLDSRYATWSLRKICGLADLTIADLFTAYKKALLVKAHLQATKIVTDQLVKVVEDVMRRSQPYETACEKCQGLGTVTSEPTKDQPNPSPATCGPCRGTGRILMQPELDRQKVALELGHLVTKGGGITLQQQQNTVTLPNQFGSGALDRLQQAVGEILTPRRRVIEATARETNP